MLLAARSFLWIFLFETCHGIQCFSEGSYYLTLSEAIFDDIQQLLEQHSTAEMFACESYIQLDHLSKYLTVSFDPRIFSFESRRTISSIIFGHVSTTIEFTHPKHDRIETSVKTEVHLLCYHRDRCDWSLILDFIRLILSFQYTDLVVLTRPLLMVSNTEKSESIGMPFSGECLVNNQGQTQACVASACYWRSTEGGVSIQMECAETVDVDRFPVIKLSTRIQLYESMIEQIDGKASDQSYDYHLINIAMIIEFWCTFNNCNNQSIGKLIETTALGHYDLWNRTNDFFSLHDHETVDEYIDDEDLTSTSTEVQETITTMTTSSTTSITSRMTTSLLTTTTSTTNPSTSTTTTTITTTTTTPASSGNKIRIVDSLLIICLLLFYGVPNNH